jgi:hypothetical protein
MERIKKDYQDMLLSALNVLYLGEFITQNQYEIIAKKIRGVKYEEVRNERIKN